MADVLISVDLGGTNIRAARMDRELRILSRLQVHTDAHLGCQSIVERIKKQVELVWPGEGESVIGIGISAPGPVNPRTGILVAPPNLGDCHNVPLEAELRQAFGVPTYLGNDANVAVLAEAARGAAVGRKNVIFITISTGIGGGVLTDGRLLLGKDGLGAEVGHMVMLVEGERTSTFEKEAAGPALARQARARIEAGEASAIRDLVAGDLSKVSARIVAEAAFTGDALALSIVRRAGRIAGSAIATLLHLFNPEVIVIGGGVSNLGELLFEPMRDSMKAGVIDPVYWKDLEIVPAQLGDNVSIYGAAALVLTQGGIYDVGDVAAEGAQTEGH